MYTIFIYGHYLQLIMTLHFECRKCLTITNKLIYLFEFHDFFLLYLVFKNILLISNLVDNNSFLNYF